MTEVRKNAGTARLSESTLCCFCGRLFIPGQEYAVDRAGPRFFYSHLDCRDAAATAEVPAERKGRPAVAGRRKPPVKKPIPDVVEGPAGLAEIFYRGHRYSAAAFTEQEGGPVLWGLYHPRHKGGDEPLAVERNPAVGLGGLVSWLLTNR